LESIEKNQVQGTRWKNLPHTCYESINFYLPHSLSHAAIKIRNSVYKNDTSKIMS